MFRSLRYRFSPDTTMLQHVTTITTRYTHHTPIIFPCIVSEFREWPLVGNGGDVNMSSHMPPNTPFLQCFVRHGAKHIVNCVWVKTEDRGETTGLYSMI